MNVQLILVHLELFATIYLEAIPVSALEESKEIPIEKVVQNQIYKLNAIPSPRVLQESNASTTMEEMYAFAFKDI